MDRVLKYPISVVCCILCILCICNAGTVLKGQDSLLLPDCFQLNPKVFYIQGEPFTFSAECNQLLGALSKREINFSSGIKFLSENTLDIHADTDRLYILNFKKLHVIDQKSQKARTYTVSCAFDRICSAVDGFVYMVGNMNYHQGDCSECNAFGKLNLQTGKQAIVGIKPNFQGIGLLALDNQYIDYINHHFYVSHASMYKIDIYNSNLDWVDSISADTLMDVSNNTFTRAIYNRDFVKVSLVNRYFQMGHSFDHILGIFCIDAQNFIVVRRMAKSALIDGSQPMLAKIDKEQVCIQFDCWKKNQDGWSMHNTVASKSIQTAFLVSNTGNRFSGTDSLHYQRNIVDKNSMKIQSYLMLNVKIE